MKFKDQGPFGHWHEQYENDIMHDVNWILNEADKAVGLPRIQEVFLTFAELVDPINGRIRLCLHRIEDPKGQEISPGRWIENYPVTRWRALALKVQR